MKKHLKRFMNEEDGAELVEWAIVIAIVAVIAVPVMALVKNAYEKVNAANEVLNQVDPQGYVNKGSGSGSGSGSGTGTGTGVGTSD